MLPSRPGAWMPMPSVGGSKGPDNPPQKARFLPVYAADAGKGHQPVLRVLAYHCKNVEKQRFMDFSMDLDRSICAL